LTSATAVLSSKFVMGTAQLALGICMTRNFKFRYDRKVHMRLAILVLACWPSHAKAGTRGTTTRIALTRLDD
jgi:hypothetical protein